jgi:hypothetical protein
MIRYVVKFFCSGYSFPAKVSRSREYCIKSARDVWELSRRGKADRYPGLWKIEVYRCDGYRDFKLIKRFA